MCPEKNPKTGHVFDRHLIRHFLSSPLEALKGVGPFKKAALNTLGLVTFRDMLFHLPTRYLVFKEGPLENNQPLFLTIKIHKTALKKNFFIVSAHSAKGQEQPLSLFFSAKQHRYLGAMLKPNTLWTLWGLCQKKEPSDPATFFHPHIAPATRHQSSHIDPIYPQTKGLSSAQQKRLISQLLASLPSLPEWHHRDILDAHRWPSFAQTLRILHQESHEHPDWAIARERLLFDRFLTRNLLLNHEKKQHHQQQSHPLPPKNALFLKALEDKNIRLSPSQEQAMKEIAQDLAQPFPMRRLLQGDVGSGKTLVGLFTLITAFAHQKKAAFLAPTRILAEQVFETLRNFLPEHQKCILLFHGQSTHKKALKKTLEDEGPLMVVGTHALLTDLAFNNLACVVIDEQQRFGVKQRLKLLSAKNPVPHLLMLTATPIPRTYGLMLAGNVAISYLKSRHTSQRQTLVMADDKITQLIPFMQKALNNHQKIFWLCAAIDESAKRTALLHRAKALHQLFPKKVVSIFGKQQPDEQERHFKKFKTHQAPLMVATTVIETGIDIPDVSLMIIEDAHLFGLSQLHQLRGRIGRQGQPSKLIALYKKPLSEVAKQRLHFFKQHDDGFDIAHKDWHLRGEGHFFGQNQSGFLDNLLTSEAIKKLPRQVLDTYLKDPNWQNTWHPLLTHLFEPKPQPDQLKAG